MPEHHREQPDLADDAGLVGELHRELGEVHLRLPPGGVSNRRSKGLGAAGRTSRRKSVTAV